MGIPDKADVLVGIDHPNETDKEMVFPMGEITCKGATGMFPICVSAENVPQVI